MGAILFFLLHTLACVNVGRLVARALGLAIGAAEAFLLGFFAFSALSQAAGLLRFPSQNFTLGLIILGALAIAPSWWKEEIHTFRTTVRGEAKGAMGITALLLIVFGLSMALLGTWLPPTGMDALTYHLNLPSQFLIEGSLRIPDRSIPYAHYFLQHEMGILPLVLLDPSGIGANLSGFAAYLSLVFAGASITRALGGGRGGLWLVMALSVNWMLQVLAWQTKNELVLCAAILWGARRLLGETNREAILGSLFLGLAVAVKPSALFAALPLFLFLAPKSARARLAGALFLVAPSLLWVARNLLEEGVILPAVLLPPGPDPGAPASPPEHLVTLVRHFYEEASNGLNGPLGLSLLLCIIAAWLPAARLPREHRLRGAGIVGILLWAFGSAGQTRFALPAVLVLGAAGAASLNRLSRGILIALFATSLASAASLGKLEEKYHFFDRHLGRLSDEDYMRRWVNSYPLQKEANLILPEAARVLAFAEARTFHLKRRVSYDGYWQESRLLTWAHETGHDSELLWRRITRDGHTHLLVNLPVYFQGRARGTRPAPACDHDLETFLGLTGRLPVVAGDTRTGVFLLKLGAFSGDAGTVGVPVP